MLTRKMTAYLYQWRRTKRRECLLIKGARQIGKTFTVEAFGSAAYKSFIEVNFLKDPRLRRAFEGDLSADEIIRQLGLLIPNVSFPAGETLIFLDELQACPQARTALKFLALDDRYDVIASGSLLGISYKEPHVSVPVGYERSVVMEGLDFEEFLWARGHSREAVASLREYMDSLSPVPHAVHEAYMRLLREYMATGGLPAVVQAYADSNNFNIVHAEQEKILGAYLDDIAKYADATDRVKARACYLSLPHQLAKENTKFKYSLVQRGAGARQFAGSLEWLRDAEIIRVCRAVATPQFPLLAYEEDDKFRVYANDLGLLVSMYGYEMKDAVVNNLLKGPMKGGLYENLVADMLAKQGLKLHYWMSRDNSREIEFLVDGPGASVVPIEVKASRGSTVSLNALLAQESVSVGIKLVDGNVGRDGKKVTLPLYMAMFLGEAIRAGALA